MSSNTPPESDSSSIHVPVAAPVVDKITTPGTPVEALTDTGPLGASQAPNRKILEMKKRNMKKKPIGPDLFKEKRRKKAQLTAARVKAKPRGPIRPTIARPFLKKPGAPVLSKTEAPFSSTFDRVDEYVSNSPDSDTAIPSAQCGTSSALTAPSGTLDYEFQPHWTRTLKQVCMTIEDVGKNSGYFLPF